MCCLILLTPSVPLPALQYSALPSEWAKEHVYGEEEEKYTSFTTKNTLKDREKQEAIEQIETEHTTNNTIASRSTSTSDLQKQLQSNKSFHDLIPKGILSEVDEIKFFDMLESELNKIQQFYRSQEEFFVSKVEILSAQIHTLVSLKRAVDMV